MFIGEFSNRTGLTIDTLRYYEKEGLIKPLRDSGGRRDYSENDVKWAEFIIRLKETGMPIREIKQYARLRAEGNKTLDERLQMLIEHRQRLNEQIAKLIDHRSILDEKISFYKSEIAKNLKL